MVKKTTNDAAMHEDVSRIYRGARNELPPSRLDATILQAARSAVTPRPVARSPFSSTWTVPASLAAVLVLSVALVVFMSRERAVPVSEPLPASTGTATTEMGARDETPSTAAHAPEPVAPPMTPQDMAPTSRRIEPTVPDSRKTGAPRQPAEPSRAGDSVFEALKPFGRTMPAPRAPTVDAPVSAVSPSGSYADLVSVQTKGDAGAYTFIVKIEGFGIDRAPYGDWWEVLSEDGRLLYRGILSPGDIKERSYAGVGGPIPIEANTTVWVLTHTSSAGYGPMGLKGSPRTGFRKTEMPAEFAAKVGGQTGLGLRATPAR